MTERPVRADDSGPGRGARQLHGTERVFSLVVVGLVLANAVRIGFHSRHFVLDHPWNIVWIVGGGIAGLVAFFANGAGVRIRDAAPWLGYGVVAAYLGFAMQGGVNGAILRELHDTPGASGFVLLGLGAAACQTFGKWLVLRFVARLGGLRSPARVLAVGLAVGLGFGLAEILILGENQMVRQHGIPSFPWLGIWERGVAVGFHVYSAAAIAIAIFDRRWIPIALVVALHALDDAVAGAVGRGFARVPMVVIEGMFTVVTVGMWMYYQRLHELLLASRGRPAA